ncbi:MAG: hypothetical protein V4819_03790 [Verrucomicrobiota bacterium]
MIRNLINTVWDRWANVHPFLRFLVLTGVVAALGFFALKPAYRVFKSWRLDRNLVAARKAVSEVRMDEARDLSLTVLRAGDPRIEAFRILEKSTASLRDPRHSDIARALMAHPQGSNEDRLNGFRGISAEAPLGLVGQAWTMLPVTTRQEPQFAVLFADRLIAEKRFSEAASVLLEVPPAARAGAVDRRLTRVLIGSGKKQGYDEAQRLIAGAFPDGGPEMDDWLDLLESIPAVSLQGSTLEPVRKLLERPSAGDTARPALMLARLDYAANYSGRAAILESAITRWKDREPEAVAKFLGDLGLHQLLLETFPGERVAEHPGLFVPLLEATEQTGAGEQAIALLDAHGSTMPRYEELAHRALAAAKTGDLPGLAQHWSAAMGEAKSSQRSTAYLTLYRIAEGAGMREQAELAMVEAIRLGLGPLPLYADLKVLLNSLAQQGRENTLIEICAIYLSFESGNPVLLTQYAYLACLNNLADAKTIIKAMEPLAKAFQKELPIQCVLATAYLCDGQAAKAAETLDPLNLDPAKLAPGYRAAFLTTQVLNHRLAKDGPQITQFPWKALQPSERKKFSELIRSAEP